MYICIGSMGVQHQQAADSDGPPHHVMQSPKLTALQVYDAITRHVDWEVVKCLVIAGPGFTKDSFKTFLEAEAVRQDTRY